MNLTRRTFLRLSGGSAVAAAGFPLIKEPEVLFPEVAGSAVQGRSEKYAQVVWNEEYTLSWTRQFPYSTVLENHSFPFQRYALLHQKIQSEFSLSGLITESTPLARKDLHRVHLEYYLQELEEKASSGYGFGGLLEDEPVNKGVLRFAAASCGGTYQAASIALEQGKAMNLSGGFHHAFPAHAEGLCYLNDVSLAIKKLQQEQRIKRAMIVDGDLHHGNGNAFIFKDDSSVSIYDIYQQDNYPAEKIPVQYAYPLHSDEKIDDVRYLDVLRNTLPGALQQQKPDLVFYIAGADPLATDTLGGFQLTVEGIKQRDAFVLQQGKELGLPVAVVLGGGYSRRIDDIVEANASCAREILT